MFVPALPAGRLLTNNWCIYVAPLNFKIMEKFTKVKEVLASVEADAEKFYNAGNNAAGTRVRKAMQDLKNLAQEIRAEVTEKKNAAK